MVKWLYSDREHADRSTLTTHKNIQQKRDRK